MVHSVEWSKYLPLSSPPALQSQTQDTRHCVCKYGLEIIQEVRCLTGSSMYSVENNVQRPPSTGKSSENITVWQTGTSADLSRMTLDF